MKRIPASIAIYISILFAVNLTSLCSAHDIVFCGERIPIQNSMVAEKLMNVIRKQMPGVNMPQLRKRVKLNFPVVEYYLRSTGLPEDFKYLAIVESGFQNGESPVGARGFWQLMPETAKELGLKISESTDDRDDIYKSTYAACQVLASYYLRIKKNYNISSWVLTAAAYNLGIGAISKNINRQGKDYFSMNLNPETAMYVYKIIAIKELFEYPELYMKDFGYNVFNKAATGTATNGAAADTSFFKSMELKVSENDGRHPEKIVVKELAKAAAANLEEKPREDDQTAFQYLGAVVKGKYKDFSDGELVTIELLRDMNAGGSFNRKGTQLRGKGWLIDDRVFVDLGYGSHDVILLNVDGQKGIPLVSLSNNNSVLIKVKSGTE